MYASVFTNIYAYFLKNNKEPLRNNIDYRQSFWSLYHTADFSLPYVNSFEEPGLVLGNWEFAWSSI